MNILEQRKRALEIIKEKLTSKEEVLADYTLDSLCRELLNLPVKPEASRPYQGWMVGKSNPSPKQMRVSNEGVIFIKRWEGFRSKPYVCDGGVLTIGYGHTHDVREGQRVTELEADQMLRRDLDYYATKVADVIHITLNQNQFDALVSLTYNIGVPAFAKSTLLKKLNEGNFHAAGEQFTRWVHAKGKKLPGLIRRRSEEQEMFLKGE